jgi:hypothetical protein
MLLPTPAAAAAASSAAVVTGRRTAAPGPTPLPFRKRGHRPCRRRLLLPPALAPPHALTRMHAVRGLGPVFGRMPHGARSPCAAFFARVGLFAPPPRMWAQCSAPHKHAQHRSGHARTPRRRSTNPDPHFCLLRPSMAPGPTSPNAFFHLYAAGGCSRAAAGAHRPSHGRGALAPSPVRTPPQPRLPRQSRTEGAREQPPRASPAQRPAASSL